MGVLGSGPLTVDRDHPSPVESATSHSPDFDRVSHHMSVFPSPFRSPEKHWFPTGVLGSGPSLVADDQPLPVERATVHVPEPDRDSHHISVIPSPLRSPVRQWSLTGMPGAGPLTVDMDQPLPVKRSMVPVERATVQVPEPDRDSHHMSVFPSPSRSPVRH